MRRKLMTKLGVSDGTADTDDMESELVPLIPAKNMADLPIHPADSNTKGA